MADHGILVSEFLVLDFFRHIYSAFSRMYSVYGIHDFGAASSSSATPQESAIKNPQPITNKILPIK